MANTAHLVRRQSSRDLKPQKSIDKLEMKEMRGRLVVDNRKNIATANYGATNAAFEDSSPNKVFNYLELSYETLYESELISVEQNRQRSCYY